MLEFEWDKNKEKANVKKHKIDFEDASKIFYGKIIERADNRKDYGEDRFIAIGMYEDEIINVVYTMRGKNIRIISARKGNKHERELYRRMYH